jgi:hypothetical protein
MFRSAIAILLLTAPAAAALGQSGASGDWALQTMPNGCMVQAVSDQGTMISVWGFAGEEKLGFLLQNRGWDVRDGERLPLQVAFAGAQTWPVEATARAHIDQDGPGFYFSVEPGRASSNGFLNAFTSAKGMSISRGGESMDTLPLAGSRGAIASLARCLSDRWKDAPPAPVDDSRPEAETADTI